MKFDTLISSDAVISSPEIKSKKRALELLAEHLATEALQASPVADNNDADTIDSLKIFQLLVEREKLGSTCMGHGVALPHTRTNLTDRAIGAFLKLDKGIDFDGPDDQPTDLIFALMVPEDYTDEHLQILANLASLFNDKKFCTKIRNMNDNQDIHNHFIHWQPAEPTSPT
ncbi:MAG: PTS sugar transporter subunit IIA [Gammaproteobacteria bacterium]|nr:MAG: PTS sugar transporter subunit IIA [Gammaproteobacteria bacterium]